MKKDKITFIDEKKIEKDQKKKTSDFIVSDAASDPIRARFAKFCLDKKQIKPDDLI